MIVQIKSFLKEENIKLMKEYVIVPADVNYVYSRQETTGGRVHEYATEFLVRSLPRVVSPSAQMLERMPKGFKISREGKCAMMRLPSLPKLSLQRCASQLPKTKKL